MPPEDLARLDAHAACLGLSRSEYLRRRLHQEASRPQASVSTEDLRVFGERFADLDDPAVLARAWS